MLSNTLSDLTAEIQSTIPDANCEYHTIDGSILIQSKYTFEDLQNTPFVITINNGQYIIDLSKSQAEFTEFDYNKILTATDEMYFKNCKAVGIPNKDSEVLSSFLYKLCESIPEHSDKDYKIDNQEIKTSLFRTLGLFRACSNDIYSSKVQILKKILAEKEHKLEKLNEQKARLDRKASRRSALLVYLGATTLVGQFCFIVGGTYFYFCWDVMEPMAYLMLTANLSFEYFYMWWKQGMREYEPLSGGFKSDIANKIYLKNGFDYAKYKDLIEQEIVEIKELINKSV